MSHYKTPDLNTLDPLLLMSLHRRMSMRQTAPGSLQEFLAENASNWYRSARNRSRKPVLLPDDQAHRMPSQATCDYFNKGKTND